jgi:phosphonate transport system ATP-binding protein
MADKGPLLVTDALTKVFDRARAVDNVSLDIPAGQFIGVIGRSGAGKSTLLRLINRLTDPSAGRVLCDGIEVTVLRGRRLRVWRRRCAMIFQQFNLVGRLDVLNRPAIGARSLAYSPASPIIRARRIAELLPWNWQPLDATRAAA